jgi:hypothetical protein
VAVALFVAGSFFVGWACIVGWLGKSPDSMPFVPASFATLARLGAFAYALSVLLLSVELATVE